MDCLIRDLSGTGAKLELSETAALPEVFELFVPNKDATYRARLKWRRDGGVGVTFDATNAKPPPASAPAAVAVVAPVLEAPPAADPSLTVLLRRISELEAENAALRSVLATMVPKNAA